MFKKEKQETRRKSKKATRHHLTLPRSLDRREGKQHHPPVTCQQPRKCGAITEDAFLEPQIELSGLWDLGLII